MNQEVNFKFSVLKENRPYHFIVVPGSPWEDIEAVLEELKNDFKKLKEQAQEVAQAETKPTEPEPIQAEPEQKPQEIWE